MGNVYFDIHTASRISPYIGAGIGIANVVEADTKFAFQGMAGIAYQLHSVTSLIMEYRYMSVLDLETGGTVGGTPVTFSFGDLESHNVFVGVAGAF